MTWINIHSDSYYGNIDFQHLRVNNADATNRKCHNSEAGKNFFAAQQQLLRIDMTPMVDLGFLLITFFVFTATISTPAATDLYMPKDGSITNPLPERLALTLLLDDDNTIYYYPGDFIEAVKANGIFKTSYSTTFGLGKIIRQKQKDIDARRKFADARQGLMLLIKPGSKSTYKNVVDALDEAVIHDVKK